MKTSTEIQSIVDVVGEEKAIEMIAKAGYNCKEDLIAAALESKLIVTTLK